MVFCLATKCRTSHYSPGIGVVLAPSFYDLVCILEPSSSSTGGRAINSEEMVLSLNQARPTIKDGNSRWGELGFASVTSPET